MNEKAKIAAELRGEEFRDDPSALVSAAKL